MTEIVSIDTAYEDLANAIILRAVEDYKELLLGITTKDGHKYCSEKMLMKFFTSAWFEELCTVDSDTFLEQIGKLMEKYRLTYDVVKQVGGTKYYVCDIKTGKILEGPFKNKSKAMHRAAELQGIEFSEYGKVRRSYYRDKNQ